MTQHFYKNLLLNPEIHVSCNSEDVGYDFNKFSSPVGETNSSLVSCISGKACDFQNMHQMGKIDMGSPSESGIDFLVNLGLSLKLPFLNSHLSEKREMLVEYFPNS